MLDKATVISAVKRYADLVVKEFAPVAVVLYGSYAAGTPRDDSDIDVAVVFNGFNGDWLDVSSALWRLRHEISFDIEPILLDSAHDKSGFTAHVFKTGQVIYRAAAEKF